MLFVDQDMPVSNRKSVEFRTKRNLSLKIDRKNNPEKWKLIRKRNYARNRQKEIEKSKTRRYIYKYLALNHYSNGDIKCACCGENNQFFLTIDHVNNDGNLHRKEISSGALYSWLKSHNYPTGFQVLCYNCNMVKGHYGICIHLQEGSRNI